MKLNERKEKNEAMIINKYQSTDNRRTAKILYPIGIFQKQTHLPHIIAMRALGVRYICI